MGVDYEWYLSKGYKLSRDRMVRISEYFDATEDSVNDHDHHIDYYCNLKPNELACLDFGCFTNAFYNKKNAYKSNKLNFVVGSLGIGPKPFWQYGHIKYKDLNDFDYGDQVHFDAHGWLEDENGNVFDYVYPSFEKIAHIWD